MLPVWVKVLLDCPCTTCGHLLTSHGVLGIGLRRPLEEEAGQQLAPCAFIQVRCLHCGQQHYLYSPTTSPRDMATDLSNVHHWLYGDWSNSPGSEKATNSSPSPASSRSLEPSRQRGAPSTPITNDEVDTFLRLLKKTSFKVKSTTFNHWLRRLCGGPR